jgi:hypothetical protein
MSEKKSDKKFMVYIAGPYTGGDTEENVKKAVEAGNYIRRESWWNIVPVIPHLLHLAHSIEPKAYGYWMAWDLDLLARCDALLRLPGDSPGADIEVKTAMDWGMPVVYDIDYCISVARDRLDRF